MDKIDISNNNWTRDRFGYVHTTIPLYEGCLEVYRSKEGYRKYRYDINLTNAINMELAREHRVVYSEGEIESIADQLNRILEDTYMDRHRECVPQFNQKNCYCTVPVTIDLILSTENTTETILNENDYKMTGEPVHYWSPNFCPVCGWKWSNNHSLQLNINGNLECQQQVIE